MKTTFSMDRVRQLDVIWQRERNACLQQGQHYRGPSPFFIQERLDAIDLRGMAKKWQVPVEELKIYVTIQRYINSVANGDYECLPLPEIIADMAGIQLADFNAYLHEELQKIHEAHERFEDEQVNSWREATAEDFGDEFEEDLLEDAAFQGE